MNLQPEPSPDLAVRALGAQLGRALRDAATTVRATVEKEVPDDPGLGLLERTHRAGYRDGALSVALFLDEWGENLQRPHDPPHPSVGERP